MIKFDKSKKIELFGFLFRTIQFYQFQGKTKEGTKLEDLKIQGVGGMENDEKYQ
jgi:hypothetical protein